MSFGAEPNQEKLIAEARRAARAASCPYSGFHVGAAVLVDGRLFTGCNIENASYGLTICAERCAIFKAVSEGGKRIDALAVACPDARPQDPPESRMPCGACRQVIAEFAGPECVVHVDGVGSFTLAQLLPKAFILKSPE